MEHARLVLNAVAQFERLLEPKFASCSPDERNEVSRAMIKWLADAPNSLLRAALLDQPRPAEFFKQWIPHEQLKARIAASPNTSFDRFKNSAGNICIRPTESSKALRMQGNR